jgi:hypothetical protein
MYGVYKQFLIAAAISIICFMELQRKLSFSMPSVFLIRGVMLITLS